MKTLQLLLITSLLMLVGYTAQSQDETLEELKAMRAEKRAVKDGIDGEIAALTKRIREFPGWTQGIGATVGFNFNGANDWFGQDIETFTSNGFGIGVTGFANNNGDGYFWRNNMNINYNTNFQRNLDLNDNGDVEAEERITNVASLFTLNSIAGKKIFDKVFASAEARFETTFNQFADPGTLTFSAGATWSPISELIVVIHPLAYQVNFPTRALSSAAGAKIGAAYVGEIYPGVSWNSDLNVFLAYGGDDEVDIEKPFSPYSASTLSNWTWLNSFAIADIFQGIGVGFTLGLRQNDQLGFAKNVAEPGLQTFYTVGINYAISR